MLVGTTGLATAQLWRPRMRIADLIAIAGMLVLFAFIAFAFRQGMRVKPSGRSDGPTIAGESDVGGGLGGDGGGH